MSSSRRIRFPGITGTAKGMSPAELVLISQVPMNRWLYSIASDQFAVNEYSPTMPSQRGLGGSLKNTAARNQ